MPDNRNSFVAFLVACFLVVGLAGVFASYAAPLPYQRAFARLTALQAPAAASDADSPAARRAIIAEAEEEAGGVLPRIRLLLAVLTALSALFGTGVMLILRRQAVQVRNVAPGETVR